jgi:hypothetical protein
MVARVYGGAVKRGLRVFFAACAVATAPACSGRAGSDACASPVAERIDPKSSQHVLPGGQTPSYLTDPPTSGAHRPGPPPGAVVDTEIDKPTQVGILESGVVLVQYRDDAARSQLAALARGQKGRVTVAPNHALPSKIVATAWLFKMKCKAFDAADLRSFVNAHTQKAPTH